jgi:hypothetical protein
MAVDMRLARFLCLVVAGLPAAGCNGGSEPAEPKPPRSDAMTWERAEEIAREHLVSRNLLRRDARDVSFERSPRLKYHLSFAHLRVLVHRGEVLPKNGGVAPLGRYLVEIPEEERKALAAEELNQLIWYFNAFPRVEGALSIAYYDGSAEHLWGHDHPAIRPQLEWSGDHGAVRIFYNVTKQKGFVSEASPLDLAEWTLSIAADGSGTWSEQRRSYVLTSKQFVE